MNGKGKGVQHLLDGRTGGLMFPDWVAHGLEFMAAFLIQHRLKERIRLIASGKLITPADAARAL